VLVNLPRLTIFSEQPPKNTLPPHPKDLGWHTGLCGAFPLSHASVTTLALSSKEIEGASTRVDGCGLDYNATILDKFLYVRPRVGIADLGLLVRVEPDFTLANASDGCGKPLL
jgi:hypothetical protein